MFGRDSNKRLHENSRAGEFSLRHRGLLLVLGPLVFQIALVCILFAQLDHLQSELLKATRSRELITKAHYVSTELLQFITKQYFDKDKLAMSFEEQKLSRSGMQKLIRPFEQLVRMTREDPTQFKNSKGLSSCAKEMSDIFRDICEEQEKGPEYWASVSVGFDTRIEFGLLRFLDRVSNMLETEKSKRTKAGFISEFKTTFAQTIFAALVLNLMFSVGLGIAFAFGVRKPIGHISENIQRMSKRQPLLEPLPGRDELAALDRLILTAAQGIEFAFAKEQSMVDEAADMICIIDVEGRFRRINRATNTMTGWNTEDLLHKTVFDLVSSEDIAKLDEEFTRAKSTEDRITFDLRLHRKNGQLIETRWSCLFSSSEEEVFAVVHNITDEKNIESLKQDFLDMITHDLRSPLSSMLGSLTLVAEGVRGDVTPAVRQEIHVAMNSVEHLTDLVNDLLDFQKLSAGKMAMVRADHSFDEMVRDSIELLSENAKAKNVSLLFKSVDVTINCDRIKLMQVINNLMSNAIKFAPADSNVELSIDLADPLAYVIHVRDQGPGIPEELFSKVFDAFERVPGVERKEGTGLGLAICKMIVEAHGGAIGVKSIAVDCTLTGDAAASPPVEVGASSPEEVGASSSPGDFGTTLARDKQNMGSDFWFTIPRV